MISKISSSKMLKENIKNNLSYALMIILLTVMSLVVFLIMFQNNVIDSDILPARMPEYIRNIIYPSFSSTDILFSGLVGILLGYSSFKRLHSSRETDFFLCLPIKRSTQFFGLLTGSFIIYIGMPVFMLIFKSLVLIITGYMSAALFAGLVLTLVISVLTFGIFYSFASLAMILTGNTFVAALGFGVISVYFPLLIRFLIPSYASIFFWSYYEVSVPGKALNYLSPFSIAMKMLDFNTDHWLASEHVGEIIAAVVMIILITALNSWLYKKRPSEAAGRAMAFKATETPLRYLILIPAALYLGLILKMISNSGYTIWVFVGCIFGVLAIHAIIECIYRFDIRAILDHKLQALIELAICLVFILFFAFDFGGYNRWIPTQENIQSAVIHAESNFSGPQDSSWGTENAGIQGDTLTKVIDMINEAQLSPDDEIDEAVWITIEYNMKNGSLKGRRYYLDVDKIEDNLNELFLERNFRSQFCSLYTADTNKITEIKFIDAFSSTPVKLASNEVAEFINTYTDELSTLTYSEMRSTVPLGVIEISHKEDNDDVYSERYYIYPSFKNTIDYLKIQGIDVTASMLSKLNVDTLTINIYDEEWQDTKVVEITDKDVINKVSDKLIYSDYTDCGFEMDYHYDIIAKSSSNLIKDSIFYTDSDTLNLLLNEGHTVSDK